MGERPRKFAAGSDTPSRSAAIFPAGNLAKNAGSPYIEF